jgi:hypothetical protein
LDKILKFLSLGFINNRSLVMASLLNQSAARKLAKSLNIHLGTSGIKGLNQRIEEVMNEAAVKARKARRKTILERDVIREKDLFS